MQSVHTLLKLAQLSWTGHVTSMPDESLPKKILYGELQKRYKDTSKPPLKTLTCQQRSGAGEYEAKRISEAKQKRVQRKARAEASPTELSSSDFSCAICNRQFRAKIGLISHLRTHK